MAAADVTVAVDLDVDAERAWEVVCDWERQSGWIPATTVRVTQGTGRSVGDRVVARTALGRLGFDDPMEITRWDPPRVCEVRHLGRVVRGTGVFAVEPTGPGRSRFVWSEQMDLPLGRVGALGFRVVRPLAVGSLRAALRRLGRQVSSTGAP